VRGNDLIIATTLINDALAFGKNIFLATDSGIYFSSDYGENFDYSHSVISATKIYKFEKYEDKIFAGTDNGVFVFNGKDWDDFALQGEDIYALKFFGDFLFCGGENEIFVLQNGETVNGFENTGRVQVFSIFTEKLLAGTSKGLFEITRSHMERVFEEPVLSLSSSENLYLGLHSGVAVSSDLKNFQKALLGGEIIRAVLSVPHSKEDIVFAGSDSGLWVSFDSGKTFPEKKLKNVHIFSLSPSEIQGEILVGSWGRGLIKYSLGRT